MSGSHRRETRCGPPVPLRQEGARVRPVLRSLEWRIFFSLAVSLILFLGIFVFLYQRFLAERIVSEAADNSSLVADTIHLGLTQNMIGQNREAIKLALLDIMSNPEISEVLITDADGRVVFATQPDIMGRNLRNSSFAGMTGEQEWKVADLEEGREILRLSPIPNRPACYGCHSPDRSVLGNIAMRISLASTEDLLRTSRLYMVGLVTLVLLLLFMVNALVFSKNVSRPIAALLLRFHEVGSGGGAGEPVSGPPALASAPEEIAVLGRKFEDLMGKIRILHDQETEQAKEVALLQLDKAHRAELQEMNRQLQGRVSDLDDAYRKINALARQLEEKNESLQNAVKNISALNRVGVALSSELDLDKLIRLLINISVKGLRAEIGYIMLMDNENQSLVMKGWTGLSEGFDPSRTIKPGESISGTVAKTGKSMLITRVDGSDGIKIESRYGFTRRSVISAPIKIKDRLLGVIELTNKKGAESFDEDDLQMMQSIANQAAVAIENANLLREVQKSYFDTIKALVQAVEEKDKYTRGHSERVTTFSLKIAAKMGFSEDQVQTLRYGGVLHDIGKIGINVNIIQKPGRLTQEEFNIIKNHPLIGERIISPIAFLKTVLPVVGQHHERYDGLGYPLGLDASQMVPEARVLAVADAYDAMITARPYRKPLPREDAIAELRRCSGTQFDPIVVEHFLEILDEDPEIRKLEKTLSTVGT